MEGPEITFAETVLDNGRYGKRTIRFETGRLAKQAAGSFTTQRDKRIAVLQGQLRPLEQIRKEMPALPPVRVKEVVGR